MVAGFCFVTDVSSIRYGEVVGKKRLHDGVFVLHVVSLGIEGQAGFLHIVSGHIVRMEVKGICDGNDDDTMPCKRIFPSGR